MSPTPPRRAILVAEDESLLRMLTVDTLEEAGFDVIEANSGDAGARILQGGREIAGLVTDIQMPGQIDGCTLAQITHLQHPDAVILVVSGNRVPAPTELPEGAEFIGKPYDVDVVLRKLKQMLIVADAVEPPLLPDCERQQDGVNLSSPIVD